MTTDELIEQFAQNLKQAAPQRDASTMRGAACAMAMITTLERGVDEGVEQAGATEIDAVRACVKAAINGDEVVAAGFFACLANHLLLAIQQGGFELPKGTAFRVI